MQSRIHYECGAANCTPLSIFWEENEKKTRAPTQHMRSRPRGEPYSPGGVTKGHPLQACQKGHSEDRVMVALGAAQVIIQMNAIALALLPNASAAMPSASDAPPNV